MFLKKSAVRDIYDLMGLKKMGVVDFEYSKASWTLMVSSLEKARKKREAWPSRERACSL